MREQEAALEELEDLKHRLVQAATDNLDLQEKCADGEQKNASLQESLLRVQHDKDVLDDENKDLKLEVAANRASIAKLNDKLAKQSASIHKLEHINHYLSAEGHGVDSFNTYLKKLAPDEAFTLLTNRVAELDAFNKNMTDLKDMWKRKSEKLSRDYMALQREYTALQTLYAESTHNLRLAPLEEAAPAVKRDRDAAEDCEKDAEDDGEMPRKLPRAINFGSVEGDDGAAKRRASPPGVCPPSFGQSASSGTSKSSKTKTQKISRFFKLQ
ncbi:coiled-coil domain-containing protein 110 [Babesia caballi]|uniref:Coiled-coil domain-containing protein 110 n=1 Tax=Babesia caballi TaxID=5871 RepID=A0AAV4LVV3_BABCB|nr:coiled-coil domain-containing protein 110 [Babesia caballi]